MNKRLRSVIEIIVQVSKEHPKEQAIIFVADILEQMKWSVDGEVAK